MSLTEQEIEHLENATEDLRCFYSLNQYRRQSKLSLSQKELYEKYLLFLNGFWRYALNLRKTPSSALFAEYQRSLSIAEKNLTATEKQVILARKVWSDVVSCTADKETEVDYKPQVLTRFAQMGIQNPEVVYERCLHYLTTQSYTTITFNAEFLKNGLQDFQTLNIFERTIEQKGAAYCYMRDELENTIFSFLPEDVRIDFDQNKLARPRYGALRFADVNVTSTNAYGESFIVLKDVMKHNSLFLAHDSFVMQEESGQHYSVCTCHTMEMLLLEMPPEVLIAFIKIVTGNATREDRDIFYKKHYIEVMLPAINLLDRNMVEHIYIDTNEYVISPEERQVFTNLGIAVTNVSNPQHVATDLGVDDTHDHIRP